MQLSDFNGPCEASWQLRRDVDLSSIAVAYTRGSDAVYASHLGYWATNGKHWLNPQSTHSMRATNQPATSFEGMSEMEVLAISRRRRQAKLTLSTGIG